MSVGEPLELLEGESLFARDIDGSLIRLEKATADELATDVTLTIDGLLITVKKAVPATGPTGEILRDEAGRIIPRSTTIYDAAERLYGGSQKPNPIPVLCHRPHLEPVAVCRLCVVQIAKQSRRTGKIEPTRNLLPACQHRVEEGMIVDTIESPDEKVRKRISRHVGMLTGLLMADHPTPCAKQRATGDCELEELADRFGSERAHFGKRTERPRDDSSLVIAVDHDACILCDRCVRGCNNIRDNQVIGRMGKGYEARIAFDDDRPMGRSTCVSCGECMVSCPTGALTHRSIIDVAWPKDIDPPAEPVEAEELYLHEVADVRNAFAGVSRPFLQWNARSVVRRRFRKGHIVCREGDEGATAFLIESGSVEVYIRRPVEQHDQSRSGLFGLLRRFTRTSETVSSGGRRFVPVEGLVSLPMGDPRATFRAGDLFGEMSCMNATRRSATVRAAEDCSLLEMRRNVLDIMRRSRSFREVVERKYRARAIDGHLTSVGIFAPLRDSDPDAFRALVDGLRSKVVFQRCDPGETIVRQGEPADYFYLVRLGFVKVSQRRAGGDVVLDYLGPGGYFGEIGLLADLPEVREGGGGQGVRTATCSALDHVELVRISGDDLRDIAGRYPAIRRALAAEAVRRLEFNREEAERARTVPLGDYLSQGLYNANSLLVLDLERCTRCDECTKACSDTHEGVTRLIREGLRFDKFLVAGSCRSCLDPVCLSGCPVDAIHRGASREIRIESHCIGCGKCAENCPYGNINMHPFADEAEDPLQPGRMVPIVRQRATTCDLCQSLKPGHEPSCVYACPHDAAHRMTGQELLRLVERPMGEPF